MTNAEFKYMKESISTELAELLSNEFGMSISHALDFLYNSTTFSKLINPNTGLYFQSPRYVYSFLRSEMTCGRFE